MQKLAHEYVFLLVLYYFVNYPPSADSHYNRGILNSI